jgi:twitching motility protein PilT
VLATLHTSSAIQSIVRIVDVFPAGRQDQVRSMLADSLRVVISQRLVRTVQGDGRVLAAEVLLNTHAAASLIRGRKSHQLGAVIQTGAKDGMQGLDGELKALVQNGVISGAEAYRNAVDKSQLENLARLMDDAA